MTTPDGGDRAEPGAATGLPATTATTTEPVATAASCGNSGRPSDAPMAVEAGGRVRARRGREAAHRGDRAGMVRGEAAAGGAASAASSG